MVNTIYANAYKEVLVILDNLMKEDYNKIPKEYIEFLTKNCNKNYEFHYDTSKTFEQQELLEDTKYILFGLFEKFGSTEAQKEKIKDYRNNYYKQLEVEKSKQYNPDNLFKKVNKEGSINTEITENMTNTALIKYEESFFTKLKNFILKILHKKYS